MGDKMKQIHTSLMIIFIVIVFCFAEPEADSTTPLEKIVTADNDFGFQMFSQLTDNNPQDNIFISPTSIAMCLTMAYNGANGKTKDAMAKTLGISNLSLNQVNEVNFSLAEQLKSSDPKVILNIANSLWGHQGIKFKTDFINKNKKFYGAEVTTLDFSDPKSPDRINNWVSDKTNEKIKRIINFLSPPQLLVLVNAIYFKGKWSIEFDKKKTKDLSFTLLDSTAKKVPMMTQEGDYRYFEDKKLQAISLPYGEGKMSMYIFLPKPNSSLVEFLSNLNEKSWSENMSQFKYREGDITLPRFKFEYGKTLNDALINLGMGNAFAEANFSNMCDLPAFIGSVLHKTFVEVNEEGTEAAAVTAIIMATAIANKPEPFSMVVDRPFFCAICDNQTNAILFMGAVTEPK
jgi:serpin B